MRELLVVAPEKIIFYILLVVFFCFSLRLKSEKNENAMKMRRSVTELSPLSVDQRPMLPQVHFDEMGEKET